MGDKSTVRGKGERNPWYGTGEPASPKDRFLTVYGRKPVLAALNDPELDVDKVILAEGTRGPAITEILNAAKMSAVRVQRASAHRVKVLAGNGKQDQGVLADVVAPRMRQLHAALNSAELPACLLVLDAITTPSNVGMILRTATAAGIDGIVVPRKGVAALDPLVVKSSAGIAFRAPVLRCSTAADGLDALCEAGYVINALDARASYSIFDIELPARTAFVLGGETDGISAQAAESVTNWVSIPMRREVESLNVSAAAAVVCFELVRRTYR